MRESYRGDLLNSRLGLLSEVFQIHQTMPSYDAERVLSLIARLAPAGRRLLISSSDSEGRTIATRIDEPRLRRSRNRAMRQMARITARRMKRAHYWAVQAMRERGTGTESTEALVNA